MSNATAPGEGIRLGFDSYSIRDFHWKDIQLLDYAASLKLDTIQLSGLSDYESLDAEHLASVDRYDLGFFDPLHSVLEVRLGRWSYD